MILSSTSALMYGPKSPRCSFSCPRYMAWVKEPSVNSSNTTFLNWGTPPFWDLVKKSRGKIGSVMGRGRDKEGLKITSRFLIWANEWMVMQFIELENPRGVGWGIQFGYIWFTVANTQRSGVQKRGLDEDHPYLGGIQIMQCVLVTQSCLTLCNPMDCSLPVSSVHGILQARILEWVAIFFSRGSSWPRDQTWVTCIAGGFCTVWATMEALTHASGLSK